MNTTKQHAEQINGSVLTMISAVISAMAAMIVTTCVQGNRFVGKFFNVAIHGVSAAEHIARAGEERAEIYGQSIVNNGVLAQREMVIRHRKRLVAVENEEYHLPEQDAGLDKPDLHTSVDETSTPAPQPVKAKPASPKRKASKATGNGRSRPGDEAA